MTARYFVNNVLCTKYSVNQFLILELYYINYDDYTSIATSRAFPAELGKTVSLI